MLPPQPVDLTKLYKDAMALQASGDLNAARAAFERIVALRPETAEALFQIGRIAQRQGDPRAAESAFRDALKLRPKEPAIWQGLHAVLAGGAAKKLEKEAARARVFLGSEADLRPVMALISSGKPAEAEARALAHVKSAPDAFWPAFALGRARAALGQWAGAVGPLDMAHSREPNHADAQFALGQCLARMGQPLRAETCLTPLVKHSFAARLELARVFAATLRLDEAAALLREGAPRKKAPRGTYGFLAETEARMRCVAPAMQAADWAMSAGEEVEALHRRLADAFQEGGDAEAARRAIEAGLAALGPRAGLLAHRAQLMQSDGDFPGAEDDLHAALKQDPACAEAYRAYTAGRKMSEGHPVVTQMEAQLRRPDLPRAARRVLSFAAAKAAGDIGDQHGVFDHLNRANRLMLEDFPYSFDADLAEARSLVASWRHLAPMIPEGPKDPVLFVTGLPRSGTTLVETILAAHPDVAAGGEMPFLNRALAPAMERLRRGEADRALFALAGQRYLEAGRRRTGNAVFTDKAISTFSRVGHAARALPGARFVILRRDHRDVGLSMYRNMFPEGLHRYTTDLTAMGRYMRLHDALVKFWSETLPDRVHVVDYDALTSDPEPQIRQLVDFAGLPWDKACLSPESSGRRVETLSFSQVRAPIGRQAVDGWRRYETELAPLIRALEDTEIDLEAGG